MSIYIIYMPAYIYVRICIYVYIYIYVYIDLCVDMYTNIFSYRYRAIRAVVFGDVSDVEDPSSFRKTWSFLHGRVEHLCSITRA